MTTSVIGIVLADDQAVVRDGLSMLLGAADDLTVVATAPDGLAAVETIVREHPDVALVDLRMPGLDGAQVTAEVRRRAPEVRVLILTTYADDDAVLPALRAGAAGYLTKDTTGEALCSAIRTVAAGGSVLDAAVQQRLVSLAGDAAQRSSTIEAGSPAAAPPEPEIPEGLTAREVDTLRLVAQGLSNQQVATKLVVSEATVKTHVNHLISKLAVDGRPALVAWAWRHGVVS
ncbi:response regulator [Actinomycetospora termitidis]|uniref:Response regulator transcription factor n=1 Tax=Actinomycetospora termitidis TaxID=3053470 RepID=A0ABT7MC78_9PSEU|nr:response regulator transcription factor [Actinomycetospora sp. Odt1-22]MDL5158273.1 response regulator transcription factor [Actinomycetospora sp. Odt1-22]